MTTVLKRNLCDINGETYIEDISINDVLPDNAKLRVMIDFIEHGVMDGYAWIEERYVTRFPWFVTLLFFWLITPDKEKEVFFHVGHEGTFLDFSVPIDTTKNLRENIQAVSSKVKGIRDVWINQ